MSGIDDLFQVLSKLIEAGMAVKWRAIGLALGLRSSQLEMIHHDNRTCEECVTAMVTEWLNQAYDVTQYGMPTLQRLSEAVTSPAGGNNPAAADDILRPWVFHSPATSQPMTDRSRGRVVRRDLGSALSRASYVSHVSLGSDGSVVTETLC